jgi:hypothetical protein
MSYCWHKNRPSQKFRTQIFFHDTTKISGQIQDVLKKSGKSGQVGALQLIAFDLGFAKLGTAMKTGLSVLESSKTGFRFGFPFWDRQLDIFALGNEAVRVRLCP